MLLNPSARPFAIQLQRTPAVPTPNTPTPNTPTPNTPTPNTPALPVSVPDVAVTEDKTRINGIVDGCGQASVCVLLYLYGKLGMPLTPDTVTALCQETINAGQCDRPPRYDTNPANLAWLCQQHGLPVKVLSGSQALQAIQQGIPGVMGVKYASAFGGTDSTVSGHYVTPLHTNSDGTITVADPNTFASWNNQPVKYTPTQISNATPFCYIVANGVQLQPGQGGNQNPNGADPNGNTGGTNTLSNWWASATSLFGDKPGQALTIFTDPFMASWSLSEQVLTGMTGVAGICYAIQDAEEFPGIDTSWDVSNPVGSVTRDILTTLFGNGRALMVRAAFFMLGLIMFVGLIIAIALENAEEKIDSAIEIAPTVLAATA